MKIVLLGPPGSGKGTLAQGLEKHFGLTHISMGQLIRKAGKKNPEIAKVIDGGNLASDEVTKTLLKARLSEKDCQQGFVLDGYPRSLSQAENLKEISEIDKVICLEIDETEIFKRLGARLSCPNCNAVVSRLLTSQTVCPNCGSRLEERADDNPEAIQKRIDIFNQNIGQILKLYQDKLIVVKVEDTPEKTLPKVAELLKIGE